MRDVEQRYTRSCLGEREVNLGSKKSAHRTLIEGTELPCEPGMFLNLKVAPGYFRMNPNAFGKGRRYFNKLHPNIVFVNRRSCARCVREVGD